MREPIALVISDLHLSLTPPACRAESDWLKVQSHYLSQVGQHRNACFGIPLLCAGDIFDRWNAPAELIEFALRNLPDGMLCVPGQHDLPNHRLDLVRRSGYGVLVAAGKIRDITAEDGLVPMGADFALYGAGWGQKIPRVETGGLLPKVLLAHRYIWISGCEYPGAPEPAHAMHLKKELQGYTAAFFGDNHKGFRKVVGKTQVCNVGGFIRRKSDELKYVPCLAELYADGSIARVPFDTSQDKFVKDTGGQATGKRSVQEFLSDLENLGESGLSFEEAIEAHLRAHKVPATVKDLILEAITKK